MGDFRLCPTFESAFELLGKRWTGLIIRVLMNGPQRFKDISKVISDLSDRVLSERVKELEKAGIVVRHVYPQTPVRIEYELTQKGNSLKPMMEECEKWAAKWMKGT